MTLEALKNDIFHRYNTYGFADLDIQTHDKSFEGLKVYHINEIDKNFIKEKSIDEVIIAIENVQTTELFEAIVHFLNLGIPLKTFPFRLLQVSSFTSEDLTDLKIEDLLIQEHKSELNSLLLDAYDNQVILITGAAGSVGSELSRKLSSFNCKELILLDNSESSLYNLQQELLQHGLVSFKTVVADIRDGHRMDQLFNIYKPKIVFHAAAYKHVPLMEEHPYEAVKTNVIGTKNLVDISIKHGINKFILISTDKAVNPTNVMGATKRIAELYINSRKEKGQTKFITTRFGNVLASNGSVIPLFKSQIEAGGPVTITQKDIERFFMTISKACELILEAGAMGTGSEVFVFDMGKPMKVYNLAKMMIQLSGKPIDIKITGLRPGEKVVEELIAPSETAKSTYHPKIKIAQSKPKPTEETPAKISELCNKVSRIQNLEIVALIKAIVPEYISNNSKFGVLDKKKR